MIQMLCALAAWCSPLDDRALADAQIWVESRGDATATACPFSPPTRDRDHADPRSASARRPCYCGVFQGEAHSPAACLALRSRPAAEAQRRVEMSAWLRFCQGRVECALAGYSGGVKAARAGSSSYARTVLRLARRLRGSS